MSEPVLALSELTGRVYVVTRWRKDGSASTKYDITDQFTRMEDMRLEWLLKKNPVAGVQP